MTENPFTQDYYMDGPRTGLSNYENYRWLPDLTIPAVLRIVERLSIQKSDTVLDFGCARGYMVKAFRFIGIEAYGFDISEWAILNCDPDVRDYVTNASPIIDADWIIAKDVLEHVEEESLAGMVRMFLHKARKGVLIIVPLTLKKGCLYVNHRDNQDVTHVIRWTLCDWIQFLQRSVDLAKLPFTVAGSYKQPGLKEEITRVTPQGCGFLTVRRYQP